MTEQNRLTPQVERDNEGFLLDTEDWTPELADAFAREDDISLNAEQREIIRFIRDYYEQYCSVPEARKALKHMKKVWGPEKATRKYLYGLFPRGYGQQACKIAGMRKPLKLMLDI